MRNSFNYSGRNSFGVNQDWIDRNLDQPVDGWLTRLAKGFDDWFNGLGSSGRKREEERVAPPAERPQPLADSMPPSTDEDREPSRGVGERVKGFFHDRWETHKGRANAFMNGARFGESVEDIAPFAEKALNTAGKIAGGQLGKLKTFEKDADENRVVGSVKNAFRGLHSGESAPDASPVEKVTNTMRNPLRAIGNLFKGKPGQESAPESREGDTGSRGQRGEEGIAGHVVERAQKVAVGLNFHEDERAHPSQPRVAANNGRSHHQGGGKGGH